MVERWALWLPRIAPIATYIADAAGNHLGVLLDLATYERLWRNWKTSKTFGMAAPRWMPWRGEEAAIPLASGGTFAATSGFVAHRSHCAMRILGGC